jgi:hypothetical protein
MHNTDEECLIAEVLSAVRLFEVNNRAEFDCHDCGVRKDYRPTSFCVGPHGKLEITGWSTVSKGWVHVSFGGEKPCFCLCPSCARKAKLL